MVCGLEKSLLENDFVNDEQDKEIISKILSVSREQFCVEDMKQYANEDIPLPALGNNSMIAPIVALSFLKTAKLKDTDKVLICGDSTGYLSALVSEFAGEVYTIESDEESVAFAKDNLIRNGYNVPFLKGDPTRGLEEFGEYDKIIIGGGLLREGVLEESVPLPLRKQLREGGSIIAPIDAVRTVYFQQELLSLTKEESWKVQKLNAYFRFRYIKGEYQERVPDWGYSREEIKANLKEVFGR